MPPDVLDARRRLRQVIPQTGNIRVWADIEDCHVSEFGAGKTILANRGVIHFQKCQTLGIENPHRQRVGIKQEPVPRFRSPECAFGVSASRGIACDGGGSDNSSRSIANRQNGH
jgi:hypothetical protein